MSIQATMFSKFLIDYECEYMNHGTDDMGYHSKQTDPSGGKNRTYNRHFELCSQIIIRLIIMTMIINQNFRLTNLIKNELNFTFAVNVHHEIIMMICLPEAMSSKTWSGWNEINTMYGEEEQSASGLDGCSECYCIINYKKINSYVAYTVAILKRRHMQTTNGYLKDAG